MEKNSRGRRWSRDELIVVLDHYFSIPDISKINARNKDIIGLSKELTKMAKTGFGTPRSPNAVWLKISNFMSINPSYKGAGMERASSLDSVIFEEFSENRPLLKKLAKKIREGTQDEQIVQFIQSEGIDDLEHKVKEGAFLYRLHRIRERNSKIIAQKKYHALKSNSLSCEVCGFNFEKTYGDLGKGFIECHHKTPLAEIDLVRETSLEDLALVCSNCHQMIHRGPRPLTIQELKDQLK